jgi:transposase-like protein
VSDVLRPEPVGGPSTSSGHHNTNRQTVMYCPYCGEETLFPAERGWECRSCLRAFSVAFLGLVSRERAR